MLKYIAAVVLFSVPFVSFASVGLTLQGGDTSISAGSSFVEPGYNAFSTFDGDITNLVTVSGVDTSVGVHTISYNVTDSNLDSASAFRTLSVFSSDSLMPFCSGPMAPGWQMGAVGGGCGGTQVWIPAGSTNCPFFMTGGCVIKE